MRSHFFSKLSVVVGLAALIGAAAWAQEAPKKEWKDRAEYDIWEAATKEADLNKKLQLIDSWKQKYPTSDYAPERRLIALLTYNGLRQGDKVIETAQEILSSDPKNIQALYFTTLWTIALNNTTPQRLDIGEKAAKGLLSNLDTTFAADKRPATQPEAAWKKERNDLEILARTTLGWVAMSRKDNEAAEKEFVSTLRVNPNNAQVSYWLGSVIAAQRKVEKQAAALFHFARAANLTGEGAMPEANRKQIQAYLEKVYINYHGDKSGLDELVAKAKTGALPPDDLKIESAAEINARNEEKFKKEDPEKYIWLQVKKELDGPGGPQYFEQSLKNTALPKLRGKLVSMKPAARPKELVLALATDENPEVTIVLDAPMANKADPGTVLYFEGGEPKAFTADPFMLTVEVEKEKISGWPAAPKAPARPKPGAKKTAKK